jgi:hypothetical protein
VVFISFLVLVSTNLQNGTSEKWNKSFLEIGHIGLKKNWEFYADFKNANLPKWQNAPKEVKSIQRKNET